MKEDAGPKSKRFIIMTFSLSEENENMFDSLVILVRPKPTMPPTAGSLAQLICNTLVVIAV